MDNALKSFIATLRQHVEVQVRLDDGRLLDVLMSLDDTGTELVLSVNNTARSVALDEVERVCGPEEAAQASTANKTQLNEKCVTLVLASTHFLTFSFDTQRLREYFQTCLRALVAAHHAKRGSPKSSA